MERGMAAARAGQRAHADACFQAVIQLDPTHADAWLWRAGIAGDPNQSIGYLKHLLSIDPHNEAAKAGLAWAMERCKEEDEAPVEETEEKPPERSDDSLACVSALRENLFEDGARGESGDSAGNSLLGWLTVATGVLAMLVLAVIAGLLLSSDFITPARAEMSPPTLTATPIPPAVAQAAIPSATASATATGTHTFTPEPTPTDTTTPTTTPSPTPSLTLTPIFTPDPAVAPAIGDDEKWIHVSLADQHLVAYEGDQVVFEASVSTGLPNTPTVKGSFRIFNKLVSTTMSGPDYYLPNVLYTQYFYKGYALHGAYWHDNFGHPMSHGCINMREVDAEWLFEWTEPALPPDAKSVQSSAEAAGTLVVIQ